MSKDMEGCRAIEISKSESLLELMDEIELKFRLWGVKLLIIDKISDSVEEDEVEQDQGKLNKILKDEEKDTSLNSWWAI